MEGNTRAGGRNKSVGVEGERRETEKREETKKQWGHRQVRQTGKDRQRLPNLTCEEAHLKVIVCSLSLWPLPSPLSLLLFLPPLLSLSLFRLLLQLHLFSFSCFVSYICYSFFFTSFLLLLPPLTAFFFLFILLVFPLIQTNSFPTFLFSSP